MYILPKTTIVYSLFIFSLQLLVLEGKAQKSKADYIKEIKTRSNVWNISYNSRDSLTFYTLFDSSAVVSTAAGHWIRLERLKDICRGLYRSRPDITWYNKPTEIEVFKHWNIAHENGEWIESWTQKGDTSKSVIKGKYTIMWDFKNDNWVISSAMFTALSCTGSYCKY